MKSNSFLARKVGALALGFSLAFMGVAATSVSAWADDLDGVSSSQEDSGSGTRSVLPKQQSSDQGSTGSQGSDNGGNNGGGNDAGPLGDYLKGYNPVSEENMQTASWYAAPIVNVVGSIVGFLVMMVGAAIFLITAIDLVYLAIPPIRGFLYTPGTNGTGQSMAGVGGGMGAPQGGNRLLRGQWVSDEAVECAALFGGSAGAQSQQVMSPMGGAGFSSQQNADASRGSVIGQYFKKRLWFMVMLGVCIVLLTSSVFLDTGLNLGAWLMKLMAVVNGKIENADVPDIG